MSVGSGRRVGNIFAGTRMVSFSLVSMLTIPKDVRMLRSLCVVQYVQSIRVSQRIALWHSVLHSCYLGAEAWRGIVKL